MFNGVNGAKNMNVKNQQEKIMNKTLILIAVLLLVLPLEASADKEHKGKKGPRNEFRQAVKSRIQDHHQQQKAENKDFQKSLKNSDLAQDQRVAAIKDHRETQYEENITFRERQHRERLRTMERILGDENLSPEESRTQMKEYRAGQKEENQEHRKARREENRAFHQSLQAKK